MDEEEKVAVWKNELNRVAGYLDRTLASMTSVTDRLARRADGEDGLKARVMVLSGVLEDARLKANSLMTDTEPEPEDG